MLTGKAKTEYQRDYMRQYRQARRLGYSAGYINASSDPCTFILKPTTNERNAFAVGWLKGSKARKLAMECERIE